ncbi:hypothetical protein HPP92_007988 [Vanilla planifolia]|uniref:Secreted protein n=1 Tax=Vanilla planifolia TaxID=51239 RepID=A0A835RNF9_VANPL|nr:hypothetical protein HPP92_007988 [Vanilla planifolia]
MLGLLLFLVICFVFCDRIEKTSLSILSTNGSSLRFPHQDPIVVVFRIPFSSPSFPIPGSLSKDLLYVWNFIVLAFYTTERLSSVLLHSTFTHLLAPPHNHCTLSRSFFKMSRI